MKKYESPMLVKVNINVQEAYNATYSNCVIGESYHVAQNTNCNSEYYVWVDASNHQCYATPQM